MRDRRRHPCKTETERRERKGGEIEKRRPTNRKGTKAREKNRRTTDETPTAIHACLSPGPSALASCATAATARRHGLEPLSSEIRHRAQ